MKNKTFIILLIVLLSVLVLGLTTFMIFMINGKFRLRTFTILQTESKNLVFDQTYTQDFNEIKMTVSAGNIYMKESPNEQIQVLGYGNEEDVTVDINNQKLNINVEEKNCHFFCFKRTISKIEIYLPKDYDHLIKIENNYGDTEIAEFLNAKIDIEQKYGDILIEGSKTLKIYNDYGDIKIDQAEDADIKCSAGDVVIGTISNLTVVNHYGDIDVRKVENYLDIKEDCGEINIREINLGRNSSIKNSYGDVEIGFTNEIYIDASTNLGDKDIKKNYPKSEVTLRIQNNCGDIEVNN